MLAKVVLSWVGRLVGIAAVVASPVVARAAEASDAPAAKQVHRPAPANGHVNGHAKKKATKRGVRHEMAVAKGDAKPAEAKPAKLAPKGDDADVTEQVTAERASAKTPPKPSKTPLPTIAAAATAPRMDVVAKCDAPIQHHGHKAHVRDLGHAVEPQKTPIVRATLRSDPPARAEHKPKRAKAPCLNAPVEITRGSEEESFPLTKCDGSVAPLAIDEMSVLVRPGSAAKPGESIAELSAKADKKDSDELAPGIKRIDARLVERLQLMVDHFAKPGKTPRVFVVSGYRPTSKGSFHATGRAIDFRIDGVENTDLVGFCKTLDDTGCGFYPNSSFIHMDVRDAGSGHVSWIDASAPGEQPQYVASWPPPPKADDDASAVKLLAKLDELQLLPTEDAKDTGEAIGATATRDPIDAKEEAADSEPAVLLKPRKRAQSGE